MSKKKEEYPFLWGSKYLHIYFGIREAFDGENAMLINS